MKRSCFIFPCILLAITASRAAAEDRRADVDALLSAFRLEEAAGVAAAWVSEEEQKTGPDLADALESSAEVRLAKGDPVPDTRALLDRALAIRTLNAGANDSSLARPINLLGALDFRATDYRGAIAAYHRAMALEKVSTLTLADTLAGLGQATGFGGDPRAGIAFVKRALEIREVQKGPRSIVVAESLNLLGTLSYQANESLQAELYFLQAMRIVEDLHGPDNFLVAQMEGGLASLYKERGEFARALVLHRHAVRVFENVLGANHPRLVVQYNNLGLCPKELGDLKGARAALDHALEISEKTNGPESSTTAAVLGNLGIVFKESGDLEAARDAYERGLAIQEKRLGPDHQLVGAVLYSLGSLLADMGDAEGGKARMERALAITEKSLGPGSVRAAQIMDELGRLFAAQKDFKASRAMFVRAWEESRRAYGDNNPHTVAALASVAQSYSDMGDFAGARERYKEALRVQERQLGAAHQYTLDTVYAMARNEQAAGSYAAALNLFNRVSEEWRKQFGSRYSELADSLGHAAECLDHLGRRDDALKTALESAAIRRNNLEIATHGSGEREALLYATKDRTGLNLALRLAGSGTLPPGSVRDVWDAVIRERALVLDEMAERQAALEVSQNAEISPLAANVTSAREALARAVVRGPETDRKDYAARLAGLRSRVDEVERQLAVRSKRFLEHISEARKGFAEVAASIPEGSSLIAYSRDDAGYVAFVLRAGEQVPRCVPLGTALEVDGVIARWRKEIDRERDSMGRAAAANEASYRQAGFALKRAIWDPVAKLVASSRATYIVGDGAIQLVNFLSLPVGTSSYLVESGPELRLLSSEKDIAEPHKVTEGALLAIGGPAFDARASQKAVTPQFRGSFATCDAFKKLEFTALPGSVSEIQAISHLGREFGIPTVMLSGENATEAAFKNLTPGKTMIHVATHGFFLDSRCLQGSGLSKSPLLRAGLAFAGANRRMSASSSAEDGILTAEEVASLNLESAEWVVLSGCDTGAGEVQYGEGVMGLRRAFRIAGVQTLVMSLWPVDDQATRLWMIDLYEAHLARKWSAAASVRWASQRQLRERRSSHKSTHPFYWAGFIAVGS